MRPSRLAAVARKELLELGSRRQLFLARTLYAGLLFLAFAVFFFQELARPGRDPLAVLGRGKPLFDFLVAIQFAAIYLFLPALMAGAIAEERERDSLAVLLLTRLRPREVLIGKLLGRLAPMVTMLFLSLPPMAIAYAYGGVSPDGLALAFAFLAVTCLQVGSASLACSAGCRTAAGALAASYAAVAVLHLGLPAGEAILRRAAPTWLAGADPDVLYALVPAYLFLDTQYDTFAGGLARSVPALASAAACLALARMLLTRPARTAPAGRMRRALDRVTRLGGALRGRRSPPGDEPIAWREARRVGLGERRHRIAAVLAVTATALAFALIARAAPRAPTGDVASLSGLVLAIWAAAALAIAVRGADLLAGERAGGTLDLLLAAPIGSEEIVRQKMARIWRWHGVLWFAFLTLFVIEAWTEAAWGAPSWARSVQCACALASSVLSVAVFLPGVAWASSWAGLRVRGRVRAAIAALLAAAALAVAPAVIWIAFPFAWKLKDDLYLGSAVRALALLAIPAVVVILVILGLGPLRGLTFTHPLHIALVSPLTALWATEYAHFWPGGAGSRAALWIAVGVNLLVHAAIGQVARHRCLAAADRYLGRM